MADERLVVPYTEGDLIAFLSSLDIEAKQWRSAWDKTWDRNVSALRNEGKFTTDVEPMFYAPIIAPAVKRKAGMLVENKPAFDVKVRKRGLQATADTLKKIINATWDELGIPLMLETLSYFLGAFGCGYVKITYDYDADYGNGDIAIIAVDPRMVYVDPSCVKASDIGDPTKCAYIREDSIQTLAWIKKKFPKTASKVTADNLVTTPSDETRHSISWYKRIMDKFRAGDRAPEGAIPRVLLKEYHIDDGETSGGRHIFMTGDGTILNPGRDEQENPYFDGLWPYEALDNEPDLDHPFGHAEVNAIRKLDEAFNRVGHQFVRAIVRNVPWNIADTNSIAPETLQDLKELEEVVIEKTPGRQVQRVPATMPTDTNIRFMQQVQGLVDFILGFSDPQSAMGGKGRAEVRSMPQFEGLQQASQILVRSQCRRLEAFMERMGAKMISRYFQFYTDDRIMVYVDKDIVQHFELEKAMLTQEIAQLAEAAIKEEEVRLTKERTDETGKAVEDSLVIMPDEDRVELRVQHAKGAWKLFRFKIVPFSSLSSSRTARAQMLMQLVQLDAMPMSEILKELGFENYKELRDEALKEKAELLKMYQSLGLPSLGAKPPGKGGGKK
jgi:hypothetical protein